MFSNDFFQNKGCSLVLQWFQMFISSSHHHEVAYASAHYFVEYSKLQSHLTLGCKIDTSPNGSLLLLFLPVARHPATIGAQQQS